MGLGTALLSVGCGESARGETQARNPGFEQTQNDSGRLVPAGWVVRGNGYEMTVDGETRTEGRTSLRSRRKNRVTPNESSSGAVAAQPYLGSVPRGGSIRLTGWIRTEGVTDGYAGLWVRVDGDTGQTLLLDDMEPRGPRGTTPWTRYVIQVPVDSSAAGIAFGALHTGSGTAWFDDLRIQAIGGEGVEPPRRPAKELSRLLTNTELAVEPDPAAPAENPAWVAWVRENARPIRSFVARDFSDLRFLAPLLEGKRIVQLGESGHGVREFNMAKVRLIQYLHEELGYDVLAFESSLFECDRAGRAAALFPAEEMMRRCIFGVWHTEELVPLFEYVKRTQGTARPLVLTGFDVQASSPWALERPAFLRRVVDAIDGSYAQRVYETDLAFARAIYSNKPEYAGEARDRLVAFYDSLADWLRVNQRALVARFPGDPAAPILARQTAGSMSVYVQELAAGLTRASQELRDRGMADNLDFILNELHPGKKVITWGHNSHLRHRGYGGQARPDSVRVMRMMGTYVAERHRPELYTVGLYMYRGNAAHNNRSVYRVRPATPGSLESILHRAPWRYAFIDLSRAERGPRTEWMFKRIPAKAWGRDPEQLVLHDESDGIPVHRPHLAARVPAQVNAGAGSGAAQLPERETQPAANAAHPRDRIRRRGEDDVAREIAERSRLERAHPA